MVSFVVIKSSTNAVSSEFPIFDIMADKISSDTFAESSSTVLDFMIANVIESLIDA